MECDLEKYLPLLDETDMTPEEKEEFIRRIWSTMGYYVDHILDTQSVLTRDRID